MDSTSADVARRLTRPDVAPTELSDIAAAHPDLRLAVAAHPNCSPELRAWIAQVTTSVQSPAAAPVPPVRPAPPALSTASVRRARLPWIVAAVAVIVALGSMGALVRASVGETASAGEPEPGCSDESGAGERGFASPEEAVDYFVARVAAGDLAGATEAFTVTSVVDGFSFQASSERVGVVSPMTWLPESSPGYRAINEDRRRGDVALQMCFFVEHVTAPHREFSVTQPLSGDLAAADLEADLAPEHLAGVSVIRVDELIAPGVRGSEYLDALGEAYGADELREVAVLYGTADGPALGGMQLLRFGDEWYVWNLTSAVMSALPGSVERMSEQEYLAALAQVQG